MGGSGEVAASAPPDHRLRQRWFPRVFGIGASKFIVVYHGSGCLMPNLWMLPACKPLTFLYRGDTVAALFQPWEGLDVAVIERALQPAP